MAWSSRPRKGAVFGIMLVVLEFVLVLVALALAVTMLILLTKHYEVSNEKLSGSGKDSALGSVTT